jgi:hypothetical protein
MSMEGFLAPASPETVRFLGRVPEFETFMTLLEGPTSAQLGQMWDAVDRVVSELLDGRASISTGIEFTDDLSFGPATFLPPSDVKWMAASLAEVSEEQLAQAFAAADMREAYPEAVFERTEERAEAEACSLISTREALAAFRRAATGEQGLIFVVL